MKRVISYEFEDTYVDVGELSLVAVLMNPSKVVARLSTYSNWLRAEVKHGDHREETLSMLEQAQERFWELFGDFCE